jgi:hypothetical protein
MLNVPTPIPGESLTREPRNAPYERPPELNDPEDALIYHIEQLTNERRMGGALLLLENGLDIRTVTEGVLRKAVVDGIHNIDVSMLIAPAVHEYIKTTADMVGVDYKEGFETDKADKRLDYAINTTKARKALEGIGVNPKQATQAVQEAPDMEALEAEDQELMTTTAPAKSGLMARRIA